MNGPDKCDPTMMLNMAKNMGDGPAPATPGDVDRSPAQKFDGAATSAMNIMCGDVQRDAAPQSGFGGPPAGVDRFNGSGA